MATHEFFPVQMLSVSPNTTSKIEKWQGKTGKSAMGWVITRIHPFIRGFDYAVSESNACTSSL